MVGILPPVIVPERAMMSVPSVLSYPATRPTQTLQTGPKERKARLKPHAGVNVLQLSVSDLRL